MGLGDGFGIEGYKMSFGPDVQHHMMALSCCLGNDRSRLVDPSKQMLDFFCR